MYPVSTEYQEKIKENNRIFECKIQIEHSQGTLYLSDKDLVQGSLTYTESSQSGEEFTVGSTVASDISFTILNKPEYHDITFMGATVFVNIGLQIQEGIDAHFLQPSQPSKMKGYEEKWEYVPLGRFNIDDVNRQRNTIQIKAIDNMINLDKPYSLSKLSYPATLYQIYVNICNVGDIPVGTTSFPNQSYVVNARPDDELTLRDVLGYVSELAGCFAKCNRHGALELKWYEQTDITLGPENRFNFKPSDDVIQIKGIMATTEDKTYLAGSEDYAIDLSENPLLQGNYETVLPNILANVENTIFTPYTSDWQGNPAIQAGDIIKQIDRDGKEYNTLVTKSVYKHRGKSILEARGLSEISRGYKGSTNRKIAEIKRKVDVEIGDKLTTLEQAQLNATELMTNMLGGYLTTIKDENDPDYEKFGIGEFIHDAPLLRYSTKIWKWGIGGFGYSNDGGLTYKTAVTADGSIVAMLVAANIITADMVQTGILTSEDGSTWINLDNGSFNFKNALRWVNGQLLISSPSIPPPTDTSGLQNQINDIKDLKPGVLKGGITTINNERVRVEHGGTSQYSEIRADGFVRKWQYGEARYLNDIYVVTAVTDSPGGDATIKPPPVTITLPTSFKNRNFKPFVFINSHETWLVLPLDDNNTVGYLRQNVNVDSISKTTPSVTVSAYSEVVAPRMDRAYGGIKFQLVVIGE